MGARAYAGPLVSAPETAKPAAEAENRLGKVINGRYLIQQLLGEGGMGSVYLAEHTHMKKRVAIKLLHPEMSDNAEVSARFEREAMAAAHIEHPNVAGATDFGKTEDGAFFLVLEYVEGTNLRDTLAEGPLSAQRALRITRQIALALERAHDAGIVHRDLKPENVMLVKKGDEPDFVKVLDFGIAKVLEGAASASAEIAKRNGGAAGQPLTRMGTILGTPEYMAPEQALGEPVTPAADLYGVGVMLYEMLTGKHPFDPPDRMAMLSFHIVAPVPLMQDRAPAVDVPAMVEAVVRCLLEKDSKKRYANARALIEAIENAAAGSGIDLGLGVPSAVPSQPGGSRTPGGTAVAPDSSAARGPGWIDNDAFAKTSLGVPVANTTTASGGRAIAAPASAKGDDGGGRTSVLETLGQQPRGVLYALAAALPLGFILVIVVVVLAIRSPKVVTTVVTADGGTIEITETTKGKVAPPDRVKAAVALGPEALETLAKEYPDDPSILQKLAVAYQAQGKNHEALTTVRALLVAQPTAAGDDEILQVVTSLAAKGQGSDDDEAFALLEGPLGASGVDALIDMTVRAPGREGRDVRDHRARASKSLAKPEVRAHASPAAAILLDFKAATGCSAKHDLLARAKDDGDARLLPSLKPLKVTRGCGGFLRAGDCHPCMRKDSALEDAIAAVEARPAK
ncbi:MAG: serine/threonine protein kinase [Myxococcaceae bacterium]|nr:serine/threonine protein kinase [Myxococcaceae bacterium]